MRLLSVLKKNEKAQSLVEFALVLPVLLLLVLGMLEYGWMLNAKISVTGAAREGARASSVIGKDKSEADFTSAAFTAANQYMGNGTLDADDVKAKIGPEGVTVSISYEKKPLIGFYIKGNMSLNSSVTMRME